jgi:hypothetical protein
MKPQTALLEPISDGRQHHAGLAFAVAVYEGIVRIPLERHVRKPPLHPHVERVLQEMTRQEE